MKNFTQKAIVAVMIAGASTGIASTAIITTAHAETSTEEAGSLSESKLSYGEGGLSTDLYKDTKYKIQGDVPKGATFELALGAGGVLVDKDTGEITVPAGKPQEGVISMKIIVNLPDGKKEVIDVSLGGEAAWRLYGVVNYKDIDGKAKVKPGGYIAINLSDQKGDIESPGYRIVKDTIPTNLESSFKLHNYNGHLEFNAPDDFKEEFTLKVEMFTGQGENNIKVNKTLDITFTPDGAPSTENPSGEGTDNNGTNPGETGNNTSNPGETGNNSGNTSETPTTSTDTNDVNKEDKMPKDDPEVDNFDNKKDSELKDKESDKSKEDESNGSKVISNKHNEPVQPVQNQQVQPNPSQVNTPPFVPFAPQPSAQANYGPKVETGGEVDNIWTKVANLFK